MEEFNNPFAFILAGWAAGWAIHVVFHFSVKVFSVRWIDWWAGD